MPPSGWPRAMAPPFGFTVSRSGLSSFCPRQHDRGERLVDLDACPCRSSSGRCARSSRWVASIGPVSISTGSTPTRQVSTIRALGVSPRAAAFSSVMSSTAAAPSEICDDEPAVCTPSSRATGLRPASASSVVSRRPSSRPTWWVVPVGLPSSSRSGASISTSWRRSGPRPRPAWRLLLAREAEGVGVVAGDAPLVGDALGALELRRHLVVAEVRLRDRACRGRASSDESSRSGSGSSPRRRRPRPRRPRRRRRARWPGWWPAGSSRTGCRSWWPPRTGAGRRVSHAVRAMLKRLLADLAHAAAHDLADLGRVDAGPGSTTSAGRRPAARPGAWWTDRHHGARRACGRLRRSRHSSWRAAYGRSDHPSWPRLRRSSRRRRAYVPTRERLRPAPSSRPTRPAISGSLWFHVRGSRRAAWPTRRSPSVGEPHFLGMLGTVACWAARRARRRARPDDPTAVPATCAPSAAACPRSSGRSPGGPCSSWSGPAPTASAAAAARRPSRLAGERAMRCPSCGLLSFPRLAPAVIVLVSRGDEALLARGVTFPLPMYSCIAGFVEPGETLEEAVHREVREEVGVDARPTSRYVASQPWPFPHSLMLGFTADVGRRRHRDRPDRDRRRAVVRPRRPADDPAGDLDRPPAHRRLARIRRRERSPAALTGSAHRVPERGPASGSLNQPRRVEHHVARASE